MFGSRHVEFQIVIIVFCEDTNHGVEFQIVIIVFCKDTNHGIDYLTLNLLQHDYTNKKWHVSQTPRQRDKNFVRLRHYRSYKIIAILLPINEVETIHNTISIEIGTKISSCKIVAVALVLQAHETSLGRIIKHLWYSR
jgi:hypothetical protein